MHGFSLSWWWHDVAAFSTLLAPCVGNSSGTGKFPSYKARNVEFDASLMWVWASCWTNSQMTNDIFHVMSLQCCVLFWFVACQFVLIISYHILIPGFPQYSSSEFCSNELIHIIAVEFTCHKTQRKYSQNCTSFHGFLDNSWQLIVLFNLFVANKNSKTAVYVSWL